MKNGNLSVASIISKCSQTLTSAVYTQGKDARVRDMEICVELWWEIMVGSCEVRQWRALNDRGFGSYFQTKESQWQLSEELKSVFEEDKPESSIIHSLGVTGKVL